MWFVELAKALAWPLAVVIVALAFKADLLAFVPPMLRRKIELELPGGFKAKLDVAEQQQGTNPAAEKLDEKPALDPSPRPGVNVIETRIRGEMAKIESAKRELLLLRSLRLSHVSN